MEHVYLASPFFNPAQLECVDRLEKTFEGAGLKVFSPRKQGGIMGPNASRETRKAITQQNKIAVHDALLVFAVLDWLLPEGRRFA